MDSEISEIDSTWVIILNYFVNVFANGDLEVQLCITYNCLQSGGCIIIGVCLG